LCPSADRKLVMLTRLQARKPGNRDHRGVVGAKFEARIVDTTAAPRDCFR
jgi:hypothetical protein